MIAVGVDAWNLTGDHRGIGRYVRALLGEWRGAFPDRISVTLIVPEWHTWTAGRRYRAEAGGGYPVRSRHLHGRADLDVLWFPFNGPSWERFSLPSVATLHDASTFVRPEYTEADRATFRRAARLCGTIITDSEFSKMELVRELHVEPSRIAAIPLGIGAPLPEAPVALDVAPFGRFALFVGENDPRKGLDTLIEALTILQGEGVSIPLVVAGTSTIPSRALIEHARCRLYALGHVDDPTLAALYRACAVSVYPSHYEGFGLPVLEAMNYGAPVIASSAAGIPEAGGDAPVYVPPADAAALAQALRRVTGDEALANAMRDRGYARVREMPWRKTAERTLAVLESAAR
ncbi:MAG TPA: glycosyltransferase family 1 protein [Candidatus Rubrimentiphilum sp.]|nr:glycosyltransferase family 1 protein [Candidatus Rubrimentiphilum sp.]